MFSGYHLANHFYLPGSQSIFGLSQDPCVCAHTSLSQWILLQRHMGRTSLNITSPFDLQGAFLRMCGSQALLTSGMRNMWSGKDPAFTLNCPAFLILEFLSTGNESPIALSWGGAGVGNSLPQYFHKT